MTEIKREAQRPLVQMRRLILIRPIHWFAIVARNPGRSVQRESFPFTRARSWVQSLLRLPFVAQASSMLTPTIDLSPSRDTLGASGGGGGET